MIDLLFHWLVDPAFAQIAGAPAPLPGCGSFTGLFGCGGATNIIGERVIPNVAIFLLRITAASAVLFTVYAGVNMMLAQGDSGKRDKARFGIIWALVGLFVALSSQMFVGFIVTQEYGQTTATTDLLIGGLIKSGVNIMLTLVNSIMGIVLIVQGYKMVIAQGKSDVFNEARNGVINAILGAIVVNAALVTVRIILTLFE